MMIEKRSKSGLSIQCTKCDHKEEVNEDQNEDMKDQRCPILPEYPRVTVIGAGLAGSEAAWQIARQGVPVTLYEMRNVRKTPAHITDQFAELVCSNSLQIQWFDECCWRIERRDETNGLVDSLLR